VAKINRHHPDYSYPDWTLELTGQQHRVITVIQNTKSSPEQYARLTNFIHALVVEWTRMRRELDIASEDGESRKRKPKKKGAKRHG